MKFRLLLIVLVFIPRQHVSWSQESWPNKHQEETNKLNQSASTQIQYSTSNVGSLTLNEARTISNQTETTKKQEDSKNEAWNSPAILVQIGLLIVGISYTIFACLQWCAIRNQTETTAKHLKTTERAYVRMTHSPPGLSVEQAGGSLYLRVQIQIKNFGRTPTTIIGTLLTYEILPSTTSLPISPNYENSVTQKDIVRVFLVTGDEYFSPRNFPLTANEWEEVRAETKKLYLYGYVDYRDQFGQRFRGGYARVYEPRYDNWINFPSREDFNQRTNLLFITQDGYNYDYPRQKDEG